MMNDEKIQTIDNQSKIKHQKSKIFHHSSLQKVATNARMTPRPGTKTPKHPNTKTPKH